MVPDFDGKIAEVVIYDHAVSRRERRSVNRAVAKMYRLLWYQRLWDWVVRVIII